MSAPDTALAEYDSIVESLGLGKRLPDAVYLHTSALDLLDPAAGALVDRAATLAGLGGTEFNVVKFGTRERRISLLSYPDFFEAAFPALATSWAVDLELSASTKRSYASDGNPPILHRKETLLDPAHPAAAAFTRLTEQAEDLGLFRDAKEIGRKRSWEARVAEVGMAIDGNSLVHIDANGRPRDQLEIQRHRTAMVRYTLSGPMQALWRHGYLDGHHNVFDYGCGRGDDLRALRGRDIAADGWDPHFAPGQPKQPADIVNLGFVLNVIEDPRERRGALHGAWELCRSVLAVAVILGGRTAYAKFARFGDGVMTARGTFQKYYSQEELREYLVEHLERDPVAVGPGMFFVFKSDDEEQKFLAARQLVVAAESPMPTAVDGPRPSSRSQRASKWDEHSALVSEFWRRCLELGRVPEADELESAAEVRRCLGTSRSVYAYCVRQHGERQINLVREQRKVDRLVYLALNIFERRRSFGALPQAVQRDVRAFWGSFQSADTEAKQLLFSAGRPAVLQEACAASAEQHLGCLEERAFIFHSSVQHQLPAVLRTYLGCAQRVYGEFGEADLIKVHIGSNKVSLMRYDSFEDRAVPLLLERIKITLGRADFQVFEYGDEFVPQPLYLKSRYLPPSHPLHEKQRSFDTALEALNRFDFSGFGPDQGEFQRGLLLERQRIDGFQLRPL